ncbi:N-acetyltransferase [Lacibacter luteus]|uniref:N-acetyltransferase n=1 Tax=Lacibacter luteus TaxID=2508719 RepID=A0A4Q1CHN2_9BACT|nr:GNAT family N-acetyltransferase [Lacibacter luteus]RXK59848.1 N-acetyltransferase [Lacibacter luteus]
MQIIFETARLYFRQFTSEDAPLIFALNQHAAVVKYVHELPLLTVADAERVLQNSILPQYSKYDLGRYAVYTKHSNAFIGWCGLKYRQEIDEVDLGYRFIPSSWGKGYGTEAAANTLHYGFQTKKLNRITGRAHIENIASLTILRKIGMQYLCNEVVDNCPVETYEAFNPNVKKSENLRNNS